MTAPTTAKNGGQRPRRELSATPVRDFNGSYFGRCETHRKEPCDCVIERPSVSYCGRAISPTGRILIEASGGKWSSGQLATCKSAWCCDFCAERHELDAIARARFHISEHLAKGKQIGHLTLTIRHKRNDSLAQLFEWLDSMRRGLLESAPWKGLGLDGYCYVLQVKWSREHGWHPHYHFLLFFDAPADVSAVAPVLQKKWGTLHQRRSGRRPSGAATRLREVVGLTQALYPWDYADDGDEYSDDMSYHPEDYEAWWYDHDYHPDGYSDDEEQGRSFTPWHVARTAHAGCGQAARLWEEFYRATKGRSITTWSRSLCAEWSKHEAEAQADPEPVKSPVALIESRLWNMARFKHPTSCAETALGVGAAEGLEAMASFLADKLRAPVSLGEAEGLPYLHLPTRERDRHHGHPRHHRGRPGPEDRRRHPSNPDHGE